MLKSAKCLFKYSGSTSYALQNLKEGTLFCQHYAAYNDPFECWARIIEGVPDSEREPDRFIAAIRAWGFDVSTIEEARADSLIREHFIEYFNECQGYVPSFDVMREGLRIVCFSSEQDNLLLWSHYGDGLRGFCVEFDENSITNSEPKGDLLDVAYLNSLPKVDSFVCGIAWDQAWYSKTAIQETNARIKYQGKPELRAEIQMYEESGTEALKTIRDIWQQVFATKPAEWSYERERRLLVQTNKSDNTPLVRSYPREAVRAVIIGERMPDAYKAELLAVLAENYAGVPVRTARRAQSAYALVIE